ncbi:hypothetical protein SAMN05660489_02412, partial [Pseudomonas sp. LAMO17WK12:I10]|uniref:Ig-like domain-containing protein n=1 Tax=unclassified Pseudomonas TaxID=196821 RepID=UPI000BD185DC
DSESGSIILTREVNGKTEHVTVGNGLIGLTRDLLVFADGAVRTDTVRSTLAGKGSSATVDDLRAQGALTSDTVDDWKSDTFTGGPGAPKIAEVGYKDQVSKYHKYSGGVSVYGSAAAGSTVELEWAGARKSVTADANNQWSTSFSSDELPADGNTTITATVTSQTGKVSTINRMVTVDTIAPDKPVLDPVTGDNRITAAERAAGLTLTGSAEAGSKMVVYWNLDGDSKNVNVDDTGKWSLTLTNEQILNGNGTLHLLVRDQIGNSSDRDYQVQMDASEPGTLIVSPLDNMVIGA